VLIIRRSDCIIQHLVSSHCRWPSGHFPLVTGTDNREIRVDTIIKQRRRLNGEEIIRSSDFCYLGSIVAEDGGTSKEVNVRI
jgi:hypothetical protein